MTDQHKLRRLLQILMALDSRQGMSIDDICNRFDISDRTVYRYFELFKEVGFVLDKARGRFRLLHDCRAYKELSKLLHFSEEESYLLQQAINSIDSNNQIKQNLVNKLYSLYDARFVAENIINQIQGENIRKIITAIDNKRQILLKDYKSASGASIKDRRVEPIEFTTNYVSLWCYDADKKANKLFKISRIGEVEMLKTMWQHEDKHNATKTDVFRMAGGEKVQVIIEMSLRAASLLKEEYPLSEKNIVQLADDKYRFQADLYGFEGISRFALGLMDEVSIIKPESLRQHLNDKMKKHTF
ncbi:MAG: WYL domain-containing transcriptional regulator [Bacteroidales bacterium]